MQIFISGGCKNGKSTLAQDLAVGQPGKLYYIATMNPADDEDAQRIVRHRKERAGMNFITIEQPVNIEEILEKCHIDGSFLLDSLTALLANEMFSPSGDFDENACERVGAGLEKVLDQIPNIVIVSDYIYSDAIQYDPLTETYRKSLAALDALTAARCDVVLEASYTQITAHKGSVSHEIY
ncbi:MAG: bifunctional adenosylcobinamide kinase/adenosylcobinamide-phosphate guanylyltransferase [Clostridiales bacterium]|jgi:adenosylcobinamide kinase/adenosylcobinamide-phosphate guanylyltransferase|nr:bifunctional adenosylcobinamide kinase/adenosylcobinamide-phosphate guanylyltransferase [Clostridiales bacterium]